jgi:outer membrane receptor protein involved in Fe transport
MTSASKWKSHTSAYGKLSCSVAAMAIMAIGGAPAMAQDAASPPAEPAPRAVALDQIVVTATRRSESMNKVPLAIQALSGEALTKLNVVNFDKFIEFLPNVRSASRGPGASSIYIRGLSTDSPGLQVAGTAGTQPSVALYVNDAPASLVGRNLDLYAVDLQRIEVLAGPQGTLFGASAMGGAVRYITNKPDLAEFHAGFNGSYSFTKGGSSSQALDAFVNIPVIKDRLAVRLVVYGDQQGGYIDNVRGTYQMPFDGNVGEAGKLPTGNPLLVHRALESCIGVSNCTGSGYNAPSRAIINNDAYAKDNYNDASYAGFRAAATFKLNEDWSIDLMHVRQKLKTEGVFDYEPDVGDLQVTQFGNNSLRDDTDLTTWTLNGRLAELSLIYTGSYMHHNAVQNADYSGYSNIGFYLPYYECDRGVYYTAEASTKGNKCYAPNKSYQVRDKTLRYTHEFRVVTPGDKRLRGTAGLFYDINKLYDDTDWSYASPEAGFIYSRKPNPVTNPYDGSVRTLKTAFLNDVQRRDRQFAAYGEASFDIVPKSLILTGGVRYYNEKASMNGSSQGSFCSAARGIYDAATGTYSPAPVPTTNYCVSANLNTLLASVSPAKYTGTLFKGNLTYKFGQGSLIYATYSDGFRPGGFNRKPCNVGSAICPTLSDFAKLAVYTPDKVKNYEVGGKFALLDRSMQINVAAYQIDWSNVQMTVFDQNISNQTFTSNFIDARIKGVEGDITYRPVIGLTLNGAFSYNDSKITRLLNSKSSTVLPVGSPLALSPKFQFNLRARYEKELSSGLRPFVQAAFHHVGAAISSDFGNVDFKWGGPTVVYNGVTVAAGDVYKAMPVSQRLDPYSTVSLSFGVGKDAWNLELFADNLTDARPQLFKSSNDGELRVTTARPRTIGLRLGYRM